jgi:hypothetical protein
MREVEIRVRDLAEAPESSIGVKLMKVWSRSTFHASKHAPGRQEYGRHHAPRE